jgi:hypothetical protein
MSIIILRNAGWCTDSIYGLRMWREWTSNAGHGTLVWMYWSSLWWLWWFVVKIKWIKNCTAEVFFDTHPVTDFPLVIRAVTGTEHLTFLCWFDPSSPQTGGTECQNAPRRTSKANRAVWGPPQCSHSQTWRLSLQNGDTDTAKSDHEPQKGFDT